MLIYVNITDRQTGGQTGKKIKFLVRILIKVNSNLKAFPLSRIIFDKTVNFIWNPDFDNKQQFLN